jgi:hypothetical protein
VPDEQRHGCLSQRWLSVQRRDALGRHDALQYRWASRREPRVPPTYIPCHAVGSSYRCRGARRGSQGCGAVTSALSKSSQPSSCHHETLRASPTTSQSQGASWTGPLSLACTWWFCSESSTPTHLRNANQ